MLLDQIKNYEIFRPKCDYTKEILHALATFDTDISPVFPYLNAELGGWDYDGDNHVLHAQALRRQGVHLAAARDCRQGGAGISRNPTPCWSGSRGRSTRSTSAGQEITPRYTGQAGLKVMNLLRLLPMTNCKACGYTTCMAYAAALREGEISPNDCPPLWEEKYREKREKLQAYLESFGWQALDAE